MLKCYIVDDELDAEIIYRSFLRKYLHPTPVEIKYFSSAKSFLNIVPELPEKDKRLIISDINMPEMTGLEMLEAISEPIRLQSKIYMITAYDNEKFKSDAKNLGATRYFVKPIDFQDVARFIKIDFSLDPV